MRVAEDLGAALHGLLARDPSAFLLGEDVADPYGGAFKVTRGLSGAYPERVRSTPISEAGFTGLGCGLALAGHTVIVEIMFADFLLLAFDPIVNFAAKSVSMYGHEVPMRLIVRAPAGGRRGYGATHSQSPQKHFVGVPGLAVFEMSPLHPNADVLDRMVATGRPCLFVEDKVLYGERTYATEPDDLFELDYLDTEANVARLAADPGEDPDHVLVVPGGLVGRARAAARRLLLHDELSCHIVVPSRLYPFDVEPLLDLLGRAGRVTVAEEPTPGGGWGAQVAAQLYPALWGRLRAPITVLNSADRVIPAARHLEDQVVISELDIYRALRS